MCIASKFDETSEHEWWSDFSRSVIGSALQHGNNVLQTPISRSFNQTLKFLRHAKKSFSSRRRNSKLRESSRFASPRLANIGTQLFRSQTRFLHNWCVLFV